MTRWTTAALLLLVLLLGLVTAGVIWTGQRDRGNLAERFAQERLQQIDELASEIAEDFSDIGEDLRFAGQLVQAADNITDRERELRALLAVVKQYRLIEVYNNLAQPTLSVLDPVPGPFFSKDALATSISDTVKSSLRLEPGRIETSTSLQGDPIGWLRAFATALPTRDGEESRAVAVLVDTQSFFNKLRIATSKVILLGAHGRPLPATDALLAKEIGLPEASQLPKVAALLERMRSGERGTLRFSEEESAALGLGRAEFVAAYTPIEVKGGGHWSTATLSSTEVLRAQERAITLRLGIAALLILLCLIAFGVYIVITARRAVVVQERLKHIEKLAHLHEKTEKILDNIPTGVMALSQDGHITAINQALQKKIPKAALHDDLDVALEGVSPATLKRLQSLLEDALLVGKVQSLFGERLALSGEEGQYNLHAVPLEARFPEARTLLVIEDVSELRALESQLLRAEKLATVGVLAAGIAHEIGTPLGVVRGRAEYLLGKLGEHPQTSSVNVIIDQIDHVSRTIRQLLDFSRVQPTPVMAVPLEPVVNAVLELLRIEAKRRKLELSPKLSASLPPLAANADQLQQVLVNLVMNACDACSEGGKIIICAVKSSETHVKIDVIDNGGGIIPEHRHQIFDPFFTTKKRGQGTGLGLTIASQIIRNHGSDIEIESTPGNGTRVTMRWPISKQYEERDEK
jgi:two-component system sensor histidine kinase HydH